MAESEPGKRDATLKFSEIANRLTGISTPLGGVSWQPAELEVSAARRVLAYLGDRRVLYASDELEVPSHCVASVLEIRRFLTIELSKLDSSSEFAASLRAMRSACRKLIRETEYDARAARFIRAAGHCECPGVGCAVPTHVREMLPEGVGFRERGCGAPTAACGPHADTTRVVLLHAYDNPKDDANLRVYCVPCADELERAMDEGITR